VFAALSSRFRTVGLVSPGSDQRYPFSGFELAEMVCEFLMNMLPFVRLFLIIPFQQTFNLIKGNTVKFRYWLSPGDGQFGKSFKILIDEMDGVRCFTWRDRRVGFSRVYLGGSLFNGYRRKLVGRTGFFDFVWAEGFCSSQIGKTPQSLQGNQTNRLQNDSFRLSASVSPFFQITHTIQDFVIARIN
jgi:hypothetical protein